MRMAAQPFMIEPELRRKMERSYAESLSLTERSLHCPYCAFRIQTVFSDARGHLRSKCPKCKEITVFNLAYFRRKGKRQLILRKTE